MPVNLLRNEFGSIRWEAEALREIGNRIECKIQANTLRVVRLSPKPISFVVSRAGTILWVAKSEPASYMERYCFGDDLPKGSHAFSCHQRGEKGTERQAFGPVWSDCRHSFESQFFDQLGQGYQYTYIDIE